MLRVTHPRPDGLLEVEGRGFTEVTWCFRTNQRCLFIDVTIKDTSDQLNTCMCMFVHP